MRTLAVVLLTIGSVGIIYCSVLEVVSHEPIYFMLMKVFPWFFGVGAVLLGKYYYSRRK